ncbi:hypothetical protein CJ203_02330 [Corynebacterium tuscaniense]|uniref:Uncharacterized protein n=1 Tax=Corynebacterium tuscaniense TaxID=302449 RepID=A0A2N6T7G4_9CORY|nr:hypothetical protein CJ203_02330 [Corynebacterium tuscaniense]
MSSPAAAPRKYPLTESHKRMIEELPKTQAKATRDLQEYVKKLEARQKRPRWQRLLGIYPV